MKTIPKNDSGSFYPGSFYPEGTTSVTFAYGARHQRVQQTMGVNGTTTTTTYIDDAASGAMEEKAVTSSSTTWHDYFVADGHIVAEKFSGTTSATRYFILDHLGSVAVVTDESGNVVERDSYDAWGKRRNLDGSDDTACALASQTTRGFTNQEEIDAECLVNLNARLYDPALGRFMSADTIIPDPFDGQSYNRYSYVDNRPLTFTDPTGHDFNEGDTSEGFDFRPPDPNFGPGSSSSLGDQVTEPGFSNSGTTGTAVNGDFALGGSGTATAGTTAGDHGPIPDACGDHPCPKGDQPPSGGGGFGPSSSAWDVAPGVPMDPPANRSHASDTNGGAFVNHGLMGQLIGEGVAQAKPSYPAIVDPPLVDATGDLLMLASGATGVVKGLVGLLSRDAAEAGTVTVGRWMSEDELAQMRATNRVVESDLNGVTSVTSPPDAGQWMRQTDGRYFVQFDIDQSALRAGGTKIYGPNSIFGPGLGITEMPEATNITVTAVKIPQ